MAKRKVGLLAQVLAITDQLSLEEIKTLSDTVYLKLLAEKKMSKSESKPERKPSQKRKAGKEATIGSDGGKNCWNCGLLIDANIHQLPTHPNYHEFVASVEPAGEASKRVGA